MTFVFIFWDNYWKKLIIFVFIYFYLHCVRSLNGNSPFYKSLSLIT